VRGGVGGHEERRGAAARGKRPEPSRAVDEDPSVGMPDCRGNVPGPLWQRPYYKPPLVGDELMLAGSPLGYEGSITTGIVGRVAFDEIQTDAAAYPGISGGPAVDAEGSVVGVVSSGEGENLNFLVPVNRACVRLRRCGHGR